MSDFVLTCSVTRSKRAGRFTGGPGSETESSVEGAGVKNRRNLLLKQKLSRRFLDTKSGRGGKAWDSGRVMCQGCGGGDGGGEGDGSVGGDGGEGRDGGSVGVHNGSMARSSSCRLDLSSCALRKSEVDRLGDEARRKSKPRSRSMRAVGDQARLDGLEGGEDGGGGGRAFKHIWSYYKAIWSSSSSSDGDASDYEDAVGGPGTFESRGRKEGDEEVVRDSGNRNKDTSASSAFSENRWEKSVDDSRDGIDSSMVGPLPGVKGDVIEDSVEDIIHSVEEMTRSALNLNSVEEFDSDRVSSSSLSASQTDKQTNKQTNTTDAKTDTTASSSTHPCSSATGCLHQDLNRHHHHHLHHPSSNRIATSPSHNPQSNYCDVKTFDDVIMANDVINIKPHDPIHSPTINSPTFSVDSTHDSNNNNDKTRHTNRHILINQSFSLPGGDDVTVKPRLNSFGEDGISSDFGSSMEFLDSSNNSEMGSACLLLLDRGRGGDGRSSGVAGGNKPVSDDSDLGSSKDELDSDSDSNSNPDALSMSGDFPAVRLCLACDDNNNNDDDDDDEDDDDENGEDQVDFSLGKFSTTIPTTTTAARRGKEGKDKNCVGRRNKCRVCVDFSVDDWRFCISSADTTYSPPPPSHPPPLSIGNTTTITTTTTTPPCCGVGADTRTCSASVFPPPYRRDASEEAQQQQQQRDDQCYDVTSTPQPSPHSPPPRPEQVQDPPCCQQNPVMAVSDTPTGDDVILTEMPETQSNVDVILAEIPEVRSNDVISTETPKIQSMNICPDTDTNQFPSSDDNTPNNHRHVISHYPTPPHSTVTVTVPHPPTTTTSSSHASLIILDPHTPTADADTRRSTHHHPHHSISQRLSSSNPVRSHSRGGSPNPRPEANRKPAADSAGTGTTKTKNKIRLIDLIEFSPRSKLVDLPTSRDHPSPEVTPSRDHHLTPEPADCSRLVDEELHIEEEPAAIPPSSSCGGKYAWMSSQWELEMEEEPSYSGTVEGMASGKHGVNNGGTLDGVGSRGAGMGGQGGSSIDRTVTMRRTYVTGRDVTASPNPFFPTSMSDLDLDMPLTSLENRFPSFFTNAQPGNVTPPTYTPTPTPSHASTSLHPVGVSPTDPTPPGTTTATTSTSTTPPPVPETNSPHPHPSHNKRSSSGTPTPTPLSKHYYAHCLKTVTSALRRLPSPSRLLHRTSSLFPTSHHRCASYDLQLASMAYDFSASCPSTPVTGKRRLTATPSLLTFTTSTPTPPPPHSQSLPPSPCAPYPTPPLTPSSLHLPLSPTSLPPSTASTPSTPNRHYHLHHVDENTASSSSLSSLLSSTPSLTILPPPLHASSPKSSHSSLTLPSTTSKKQPPASFWPSRIHQSNTTTSKFRKLRHRSLSLDSRIPVAHRHCQCGPLPWGDHHEEEGPPTDLCLASFHSSTDPLRVHRPFPLPLHDAKKVERNRLSSPVDSLPREEKKAQQFGLSLTQIKDNTGHIIPKPVEDTVEYLKSVQGDEVQGLFRRCARVTTMREVQEKYDDGETVDFSQYGDPHLAGAILKKFLRELSEPLMTFDLFEPITRLHYLDPFKQVCEVQRILKDELPEDNYIILKYIYQFLQQVVAKNEINLMTSANMATVFGPNIAWPKGQANLANVEQAVKFSLILLDSFDDVFLR